jgi:putative FmdB family regulatory protein
MPLYEWRCQACGSKFELLTSYENSLGEMVCTKCHSTNVRKLLSVIARPARSSSDEFGDFGGDDFGDGDSEDFGGGGCSCGGACSCNN